MMNETVYIIGESRTQSENAITRIYNSFYIAFEIDVKRDLIVDVGCTHTHTLTESFIKRLLIDKDFNDEESISSSIQRRYHGTSQKALLVAFTDARKKYASVKRNFNE